MDAIFSRIGLLFQPRIGVFDGGFRGFAQVGRSSSDWRFTLACLRPQRCSLHATDPFVGNGKLVARGNEEVATWKAAPREASREAVEALEAYLQEHATLGKPSKLKETVQAAATSVGTAMEKVSKEHEVAKRLTSVEASRVHALRRLLKLVLKINGRGEQLPKKLVLASHLRPDYGRNCRHCHRTSIWILYVFETFHRLLSDVAIERRDWISCLHLAICRYLVYTDCRLRCSLSLAPQRNL